MTDGITRYEDLPPMRDHALRLTVLRPGRYYDVVGSVKWAYDIEVTYPARDPSTLSFKTRKDAPGADRLMEDYEIAVHVWEPRKQQWVQPPNSRFVIQTWQEDLVDGTNIIEFTAIQSIVLLDKVVLWPAARAAQMNKRLDDAQDAFDKAKSDHDSASRSFINSAISVAKGAGIRTPFNLKYRARAGYFRLEGNDRNRTGHINVNVNNGRIYWWSVAKGRKWIRLKMNAGSSDAAKRKTEARQKLVAEGRKVVKARNHMLACSKRLDAAKKGARETSRDGTRYFYRSTVGRTISRAWNEAVRRDTARGFRQPGNGINWMLKGLLRSWTNTRGSKGGLWGAAHRSSHEFKVGTGLFTMIKDFQERGMLDWRVRGRTLELVGHGRLEVNQTNRVSLHLGQDVTEAVTKGSLSEHASNILVNGSGSRHYNLVWGPKMPTNKTPWGWFEGSIDDNDVTSRSQALSSTGVARSQLTRRRAIESSRRVTLTPNSALPMVDYLPHHTINVYDYNGRQMARKVDQITLTQEGDGLVSAVLVFGKRFNNAAVRFDRSISKTMGGVTHMQGHVPLDQSAPPEAQQIGAGSIPAPPLTGISAYTQFNHLTGEPTVMLSAQWDQDASGYVPMLSASEIDYEVDEEEADPYEVEPGIEENDDPFDEETEGVLQP